MKNKGGSAEDVFNMVKIRIMKSGVKKNGYFTVRLTVSVYPPPTLTISFLKIFIDVFFYLRL